MQKNFGSMEAATASPCATRDPYGMSRMVKTRLTVLDTTVPSEKRPPSPSVSLDELEVVARQAKVYSILRHYLR